MKTNKGMIKIFLSPLLKKLESEETKQKLLEFLSSKKTEALERRNDDDAEESEDIKIELTSTSNDVIVRVVIYDKIAKEDHELIAMYNYDSLLEKLKAIMAAL